MKPPFTVQLKIQRPVAQVFDAVYNPKKLQKYFTTKMASAPLDGGTTVQWEFADFPGAFPVHVKTSVRNRRIVLAWKAADGPYHTRVEMTFKPLGARTTRFSITEAGWKKTPKGVRSSYMNCQGWMHMACCLKAYLEYGVNLRKGSF
jgi:uncharacterized protein YndB with AHSA1/START domain